MFSRFVVALARDLRQEFYPHYINFHNQLLLLLNTKNTDQLEWVFTCLAYLFKFLWRFLIRDLSLVFESLLPLLSNSKPQYINNFAAESFTFITRKVKDRRNFIKLILRSLQKNNAVSIRFLSYYLNVVTFNKLKHTVLNKYC